MESERFLVQGSQIVRAVLKMVSRNDHKMIAGLLKESLGDSRRLHECIVELESRGYSRAADTIERFQYDLLNYRSFSSEHWRRIRTTNLLERVNKELKRRSRSIGHSLMIQRY